MRKSFRRLFLAAALVLPLAACESLVMSREIKREVGATDVSVNLQDPLQAKVSLWFDAPEGGVAAPVHDAAARRAAEHVRDHYAGYGRMAEVIVEVRTRRPAVAGSFTHMEGVYTFPRRVLGAPKPAE